MILFKLRVLLMKSIKIIGCEDVIPPNETIVIELELLSFKAPSRYTITNDFYSSYYQHVRFSFEFDVVLPMHQTVGNQNSP
jgi:hypothetical protein